MTETIVIAPVGVSEREAVRLDGATDMTVLAGLARKASMDITILDGRVNLNGGASGDQSGGGYLRPGRGTRILGSGKTVMAAPNSIVRVTLDQPGVHLQELDFQGRGHIQLFDTASGAYLEKIRVCQADAAGNYYNLNKNCTAGFLFYAKPGKVLQNVTLKECMADHTYHHGFSMHVYGAQEGAAFKNFVFEDCLAYMCGSGHLTPQHWATGFNTADTGDILNCLLLRCRAENNLQSGFHCDGHWTGHAQKIVDLIYQECQAVRNGIRCASSMVEKFRCGFYGQSAQYLDCRTEGNAGPGFGIKNQAGNSLVMKGCRDLGSLYGLILEYAAPGAKVEFTSDSAKKRAFQGQVTAGGTLDLTILNPPATACTFGRTERIDYIDCPNHAAQVRDKYDKYGYTIDGRAVIVRAELRPGMEVWGPSTMNLGLIRYLPIVVPPTVELPNPVPVGRIKMLDGSLWAGVSGIDFQPLARLPDDLVSLYRHGAEYVPGVIGEAKGVITVADGWLWLGPNGGELRQCVRLPESLQQFFKHGTTYVRA